MATDEVLDRPTTGPPWLLTTPENVLYLFYMLFRSRRALFGGLFRRDGVLFDMVNRKNQHGGVLLRLRSKCVLLRTYAYFPMGIFHNPARGSYFGDAGVCLVAGKTQALPGKCGHLWTFADVCGHLPGNFRLFLFAINTLTRFAGTGGRNIRRNLSANVSLLAGGASAVL